jgi:hypothetical protein
MLTAIAEDYDYFKSRINLFIALAPVCKLDKCTSTLIQRLKDSDFIENMYAKMEILEMFPSNGNNNRFVSFM